MSTNVAEMAMGVLGNISKKTAATVKNNPKLVQQAVQIFSKYQNNQTKCGMMKVLADMGGKSLIDMASKKLDNNPIMKIAVEGLLGKEGLSIDKLKSETQKPTAQSTSYMPQSNINNKSNYRDRLNKLR